MEKTITATEANRTFSEILRDVAKGNAYTITSHGREVARLVPPATDDMAAKERLYRDHMERLRNQPAIDIGPWTRDELYEDE